MSMAGHVSPEAHQSSEAERWTHVTLLYTLHYSLEQNKTEWQFKYLATFYQTHTRYIYIYKN